MNDMFKNIPPNRLMLYMLICGLLPLFFVVFHFISEKEALNNVSLSIQQTEANAFMKERRQAVNMSVISHFKAADHFYMDKHIETISFLQDEAESLQKIVNNPNFTEDETIKKRLEFLTGTGNSLVFSEGVVQSTPTFQEVIETQVHPIEVNVEDLKNLLTKIEGREISTYKNDEGRPQLLILDFKMEKKEASDKNEVLLLNMKLLKREFL